MLGPSHAAITPTYHRILYRLVPLLGLSLVAGCAVDQKQEVATYRRIIHERFPIAAPDPAAPLALVDAMAAANAHNELLSLAGEDYLQALIEKERAFWFFFPTLSLAPTLNFQQPNTAGGGAGERNPDNRLDVPLTAAGNLFNGFRDRATHLRAAESVEQHRQLLHDAQESILLSVAIAYYQVLVAERSVGVLEKSFEVQGDRLRDAEARLKAEVGRPLDVAQTKAQVAATRVRLIQARSDVVTARHLLGFLIGQTVGTRPLTDLFDAPAEQQDMARWNAQAAAHRADLLAAAAAVRAARQNVENAIGRYYPSISLNVSYFLARDTVPSDMDWNGLLSANLPIFSALQIEAAVRTAWSQYRQAALSEQRLRRSIAQQVAVAYEQYQTSGKRLDGLRVAKDAADEAYRQAEQSRKAGLATNLDAQVALDAQQVADLALVSEQYNHKVLHLSLLRSVGSLASAPQVRSATRPSSRPTARAERPLPIPSESGQWPVASGQWSVARDWGLVRSSSFSLSSPSPTGRAATVRERPGGERKT